MSVNIYTLTDFVHLQNSRIQHVDRDDGWPKDVIFFPIHVYHRNSYMIQYKWITMKHFRILSEGGSINQFNIQHICAAARWMDSVVDGHPLLPGLQPSPNPPVIPAPPSDLILSHMQNTALFYSFPSDSLLPRIPQQEHTGILIHSNEQVIVPRLGHKRILAGYNIKVCPGFKMEIGSTISILKSKGLLVQSENIYEQHQVVALMVFNLHSQDCLVAPGEPLAVAIVDRQEKINTVPWQECAYNLYRINHRP